MFFSPAPPRPPRARSTISYALSSILTPFPLSLPDIEENGVRLRLTVVDTPGFGDFVNNDDR